MTFTEFKDRIWGGYDFVARNVVRLPSPVARAIFGIVGVIMWIIWFVPGNPMRRSLRSLSKVSDIGPPIAIFRRLTAKFTRGLWMMERLRAGHADEIDAVLDIPDAARLEAHCAEHGAVLVMPHTQSSLLMARGLGQRFPLLLLVRTTKDDNRARRQGEYYAMMGCETLDVRRSDEVSVARAVLRTLRKGGVVLGAGDLVTKPPKTAVDKAKDQVRVTVLGQQVGAAGWPARFAGKAGAIIIPAMPELTAGRITLHLGGDVAATDLENTTQAWMHGLVALGLSHPADWLFAMDRHWAKALGTAAAEKMEPMHGLG